jgi:hypothetical protein
MSLEEVQNITLWVVISVVCVVLAYDVWALAKGGVKASISYMIIMDWTRRYPALSFAVGFICGHLFWPLSTCI